MKKGKKGPKRLLRYLLRGQTLRVVGIRGRPVKQIVSGRKYVLEVREKNKLVGFVNNAKRGKPIAKDFTKSMISRLKHTRKEMLTQAPTTTPTTFKLHNKKFIKYQIPNKIFNAIKKNKGRAFGFRIKVGRASVLTPFVYTEGRMSKKHLKNLITSNLLMTINRLNYRISPLAKGQKEMKRIQRVNQAEVILNYMDVNRSSNKKRKARRKPKGKVPKDRL